MGQALWAFGVLVIPWVVPFAPGPSPAVVPWLVSAVCASALLAFPRCFGAQSIVRAWLAAALISSVMGCIQYVGEAQAFQPWVNITDKGTAFANLRQRNQFATLTNVGLAALWCLTQAHGRSRARGSSLMFLGFAALLAMGNAASSSRTGLVGLLLLTLFLWVRSNRESDSQKTLLAALTSYAISVMLLPILAGVDPASHGILARFGEEDSPACASRIVLWSNVLRLVAERPWLGWGWGELDFAHYITLYPGARFCDILDNAHNLPLQLAVELGVPVAALVCAGLVWLVAREKPWREDDPARQMAWIVLAMIGLHSLLEYPLWYGPFQIACGLCIALLWRRHAGLMPVLMRRAAVLLAGLLVSACLYAAWDYHRISQIYLAPESRAAAYQIDTLDKIRDSWLFRRQVQFAELTTTPVTLGNAEKINRMANALLHFSPEPRVIEKLIESAVMLGRDEEARFHLIRYRAAFPAAHAKWAAGLAAPL